MSDLRVRDLPPPLRDRVKMAVDEVTLTAARAAQRAHVEGREAAKSLHEQVAEVLTGIVLEAYQAGLADSVEAAADLAAVRRVGALLRGER